MWDIVKNRKENIGNVMVFNYGSSTVNPINFQRFTDVITPRGQETPSARMIAPHFSFLTPYFYWFLIVHIFVHFIPAVIGDIILVLIRRKPRVVSIFWKLTKSLDMMLYFLNTNWRIHIQETQKVFNHMNERDRHLFFCDLRLLDWTIYEEKCYPPPADLKMVEDIINIDEQTPNGLSDAAKNDICYPWANLYTYSKSIAESLVEEAAKQVDFACIIYRPSMVISTYQEPISSWCGNINGPAWAFLGGGLGILHIGYTVHNTMDLIPADMCTNALLAIVWDIVKNRKENIGNVMVFNYGSSTVNPINFQRFGDVITSRGLETPSAKMIAPHFVFFTPYFYWFLIVHIFVHFIPAVIGDIALMLTRRKPRAVSIFWKLTRNLHVMFYFLNTNWRIHIQETQKVFNRMNERDRHLFFCDLRLFDWMTYGYSYWPGLRVVVLNPYERARN
ncbi:hypothetical protein PV327_000136 [Microctonus hyperodae]|uniref:Fatty acyl-CoA reductase n=1 Tax=Microctonus hyperodae TaxID=165561 RepID=A0AA39L1U3_MICHY|nr:hypothetical protein PV327_000136 [Microctonus hyperodae]